MGVQHSHGEREQIVEAHGVGPFELEVTLAPNRRDQRLGGMPGQLGIPVRCEQTVLRERHLGEQLAGLRATAAIERAPHRLAIRVVENVVDHPPHVAGVVDRVVLAPAEHRCVLAQHSRANRVKGRRTHAPGDVLAEQLG
jgi:hypothetical protein